jgi:hypothetical protein
MSEQEDATEYISDKIHEEAEEAKSKWILWVALFTAIISVLAAITGMISAHHENESLLSQMKASDEWNLYQAKGIKSEIVTATAKLMPQPDSTLKARIKRYKLQQDTIKQTAEGYEKVTEEHLGRHVDLARAVTLFQITIAISAISILTKRKLFWYVGMFFALLAVYFLVHGVM